jgi:hypothetical protein
MSGEIDINPAVANRPVARFIKLLQTRSSNQGMQVACRSQVLSRIDFYALFVGERIFCFGACTFLHASPAAVHTAFLVSSL